MISQLDNYIGRTVILSIFMVLIVLLVLLGFFQLLLELEDVERGYTTLMAVTYTGLTMPQYVYELFPIATLLGSLIGLGSLAANSELIAFQAAGVSVWRILMAILKAGVILLALSLWTGEYLAPKADREAQRMKLDALSDHVVLNTNFGFWSRDGHTFINVRNILPDSNLEGVSLYEYDDSQVLQRLIFANSASHKGDHWLLEGVRLSRFTEDKIEAQQLREMSRERLIEPRVLDVVTLNPRMLPAWDLWRYVEYLKNNGQAYASYSVAFWNKMVTPLVILVMLMLSVPFVFGSLRSSGIGERIFIGAVIGILFHLLNRTFSHMAVVYNIDPLLAAALPGVLFLAFGVWLFRRLG